MRQRYRCGSCCAELGHWSHCLSLPLCLSVSLSLYVSVSICLCLPLPPSQSVNNQILTAKSFFFRWVPCRGAPWAGNRCPMAPGAKRSGTRRIAERKKTKKMCTYLYGSYRDTVFLVPFANAPHYIEKKKSACGDVLYSQ